MATFKLTRTMPDGTEKSWSKPFPTMRKAAQAVFYCLHDNSLCDDRSATQFASTFQDTAPGTRVEHAASGYVFTAEKV